MKKVILPIIISGLALSGCATNYPRRTPEISRQSSEHSVPRNLEDRNFEDLPSNVKDFLKKENLDDVWYNPE